ncbi:hypothetical protein DYH09_17540 [bacterium CPR1]|nr:hypothetical protein [bacterium CPR1]
MHLAVELVASWSARSHRLGRMIRYGIPLALTLGIGIWAKWAFYSQAGGWRVFWWNYSGGNVVFWLTCVAVGLAVLIRVARRERAALAD